MVKFRDLKTIRNFASVRASIHNHFNHGRHLISRDIHKQNGSAALAEWRRPLAYASLLRKRFELLVFLRLCLPGK